MSLFHNLKLKRRKVDSRSSSDGSEVAATDMISPPSLASSSASEDQQRPNSQHSGFEVEVKPNKFELQAPRYTNWASPAKLKQEPYYEDEAPTITATVVPSNSPSPTTSTPSSSTVSMVQRHHLIQGGHRLAEALRPPPTSSVESTMHHLPLAAAAAAAKLQAMHPNMVSSSHGLHHPALRMVAPLPTHHKPPLQPPVTVKSEPLKTHCSVSATPNNKSSPPSPSNGQGKKPGPSVILGEHGGVKTMIWTDSTTYWQAANKYRNNAASQPVAQLPQVPPPPLPSALPPHSTTAVTSLVEANARTTSLKVERPDPERLKMSSAVDGLLSLSSQGQRPTNGNVMQPHPMQITSTPSPLPHTVMSPMPTDLKVMQPQPPVAPLPLPTVPTSTNLLSGPPGGQPRRRSPMNMERLWAGDMSQLPSHVIESQNGHGLNLGMRPGNQDPEDEEPLLCNICEDRATGLHYGIITCEG